MKYTRYDYKRKKGDNFFVWIIVVIVLSVFIGMSVYNIFIGNNSKGSSNETEKPVASSDNGKDTSSNNSTVNNEKEFGIIQCGVFTKKENADATIATIPNDYPKLVIEESGTFKVLAGIYGIDDANEVSKKLNESSVNNFRMTCKLSGDTQEKKVESEILDGYVKVINQLEKKDVKCINTLKFKEWVNEVSNEIADRGDELQSIVDNISTLPDEIKKEEINNYLIFLYNILIKYKEN